MMKKIIQNFGRKRRNEETTHLGDIDINEMGCECMDSIHVAQNRVLWRAHISTVMELRLHEINVKLSLCLSKNHLTKMYWRMEV
jgi:hypothetical protein